MFHFAQLLQISLVLLSLLGILYGCLQIVDGVIRRRGVERGKKGIVEIFGDRFTMEL
jgi:hypothetical protein